MTLEAEIAIVALSLLCGVLIIVLKFLIDEKKFMTHEISRLKNTCYQQSEALKQFEDINSKLNSGYVLISKKRVKEIEKK